MSVTKAARLLAVLSAAALSLSAVGCVGYVPRGKLDLARLAAPGVTPLSRFLLTSRLESLPDLRLAAGTLKADVLLVYTLDTNITDVDMVPLASVLSLGLFPTKEIRVSTTASARLLDTRTGAVLGVAEATDSTTRTSNAWGDYATLEVLPRQTETAAFGKLVGEVERTWIGVIARFCRAAPRS